METVAMGKLFPSFRDIANMVLTFSLTVFAWIFFRAESMTHAFNFISRIFSKSFFQKPEIFSVTIFTLLGIFMIIEWFGREQKYAIADVGTKYPLIIRWSFYYLLVITIFLFTGEKQDFIYFQF